MPPTLYAGSTGPFVRQLQEGLNQLKSQLPPLAADGQFGSKTRGRVQEFQSSGQLTADGIVGPMTWELLARLLQQVAQGGVPVMPAMPASTFDLVRPLVLATAQRHLGAVDFSQMVGGRPRGLDFLIEMFRFSANVQLTDANFRKGGNGAWNWKPWIGNTTQEKSWCGVFAVYCYRKAGIPVRWDLGIGGPVGPIKLATYSPNFAADIKPGDIGGVHAEPPFPDRKCQRRRPRAQPDQHRQHRLGTHRAQERAQGRYDNQHYRSRSETGRLKAD
jgi:peptidoglycan hydrolase-like protein with peptidoglycan-binding domain